MTETLRTYEEINRKIKKGTIRVVTADEMTKIVEEEGVEVAARDIDIVTTGTFGPMCSSGAFLNFGHSDPPIKMEHVWLNDIHCYHGNAAVDVYIGATRMSDTRPFEYGGGHIIEDLTAGKEVTLYATAYATDCYPRTHVETNISLEDINQAILVNPRNCYQRYSCAVNSQNRTYFTYMGKLLPNFGNASYSGTGELNPLCNDPDYETIGIGTRIFLGGGVGYIWGEGTQHDPKNGFGNLFVSGNLKKMSAKFLQGAILEKYGTSLYVGLGIPIPILNKGLARKTGISDAEISTKVVDYGIRRRNRPVLQTISYKELKSGYILIHDKKVKVNCLSSVRKAREIADELKRWIEEGTFYLTSPIERLPRDVVFKPMKVTSEAFLVENVMGPAITCRSDASIDDVARLIIEKSTNHIMVCQNKKLVGIVTSFDITRAIAEHIPDVEHISTKNVITAHPEDSIQFAARKMEEHGISALPVVNKENNILGMVTSEDLSKLLGRRKFRT
ncbi:MAG: homocysteine biosynthesis protein [Candidatus Helarchaeota archaeon]